MLGLVMNISGLILRRKVSKFLLHSTSIMFYHGFSRFSTMNLNFLQKQVRIFLSGSSFTKDFPFTVRMIFKQLFRVFAHVYHAHFDMVLYMREEAHLNTLFAHFICFSREFDLIERKELQAMGELIDIFEQTGRI
jgi:hypothetical protein